MLEKSQNFAHNPKSGENFTSDRGFKSGCGKMARQAPPIHFQRWAPRATFHVHVMKIGTTHVTHQYLPKSLLKQNPKPNRKLVIFN